MNSVAGSTVQNQAKSLRRVLLILTGVFSLCIVTVGGLFLQPTTAEAMNLGVWATSSPTGSNDNWRAVTYGNGRFVAVASSTASAGSDTVMTSVDGITWTAVATSSAADNNDSWLDVVYANGKFVAVGSSTNPSLDVVMTSTDGLTWATTTAAGDNDRWHSVTYGNGRFVAVGSIGDRVMTSTDGLTWATTTAAGNNDSWMAVTYGNGRFVAVGSGGDRVMTSVDGLTWGTLAAAGNDDSWSGIVFGEDRFVAVGSSSDRVMWSDDGVTWTPVGSTTAATNDDTWFDVTYGNGIFMAIGSSTNPSRNVIIYSPDGITWATSSAGGDNDQWRSIAYGNGRFVGVGTAVGDRSMYTLSAPWSLSQTGFQFRNDNGSEVAATSIGGQNSNVTWGLNTPIRLRTQIESALATTTAPYYLQYKRASDVSWNTVGVDSTFPTIVSTSSGRTTGNQTSYTINVGSSVRAGDLLLLVLSHDGASTSLTTSADWKKLGESSNTNIVTGAVYWKRATDSTGITVTTSGSEESSYILYVIRNAGTPSGQVADGSSTNSNPPAHGVSVVRPHLMIVTRSGDSTVVATVAPTGYSGFISQAANTTGGASTNAANTYLTASSTDPGTFTSATEQWVSWTILIPPSDTPTTQNLILAEGKSPATSTNDAAIGSIAWTTPGNATTSNNGWTTLTTSGVTVSNYLEVTEFGFNIPAQATIVGMEAFIEKWATGGATGTVRDNSIRLVKAGAATGNNYAATTVAWDTIERMSKYGSTSDRWGTTWTPAEINATDFGIDIAVTGNLAGADRIARLDHVTLNVYYTMGSDIILTASANIAANGASTTARMISPGTFATSSFKGGHITEDQAPTPIVMASSSSYTELEWSVMATGTASTSDMYQFRTTVGLDAPLSRYTGGALMTIGSTVTPGTTALSGTVYAGYGSTTTAGAGVSVVLARTESGGPVLYSTTTTTGGAYSFALATGTSPGVSWNAVHVAGDNDSWSNVAYGNGRFVAVGNSGDRIAYSDDGLSWTVIATSSAAGNNDEWAGIAYGNGRFVAVGYQGDDLIMYSDDGLSWTAIATSSAVGNNDQWIDVTYGNGRFVAVSQFGDRIAYSDDGLSWTAASAAGNNDTWGGITYGNGRFVAVGYGADRIAYSDDGVSWTAVATSSAVGNDDQWTSVTYGNNRFVAVGNSGDRAMYSDDGLTWTAVATSSASDNNDGWYNVAYGNGRFVAVGLSGDRVMYSDDGLAWTTVATSSASNNDDSWRALTYGNGRFVALGYDGDLVMVSDAGLGMDTTYTIFSNSTSTAATTILSGASGVSALTGVNLYGGTVLAYNATTSATSSVTNLGNLSFFDSTDDSSVLYTAIASATTTITADLVTATGTVKASSQLVLEGDFTQVGNFDSNGGTLTLEGSDSTVSGTVIGSSSLTNLSVDAQSDGRNWVAVASSSAAGNNDSWYDVTYGNGRFVAVACGLSGVCDATVGDRVMTSTDGITWATTSAAGDDDSWNSITYGNGRFVAVGNGTVGDAVMTSTDGLTWAATSAAGNDDSWYDVAYGNGRFVAVGDGMVGNDVVMTSTDGLTWATSSAAGNNDAWTSVTYGNGRFVAVGYPATDDNVITSTDGLTWATTSAAETNDGWYGVTYGNGRFVAVGDGTLGDVVMTSTDGLTWATTSAAGNDDIWYGVIYANNRFVAVGFSNDDSLMTSTDGLTWTTHTAANDVSWQSVTYANGRFVAVGNDGFEGSDRVMTTIQGYTFATAASTTNLSIQPYAYLNAPTSSLSVAGNFVNSGIFEPRGGTTTLTGTGKTITGSLTTESEEQGPALGFAQVTGTYTYTGAAATTSYLTIDASSSLTAPTSTFTITGDFTNNGTYSNNGATTTMQGQLVSGTLTATSSLGNVVIEPNSRGASWVAIATSSAADNNDNWMAVAYGNGRFVAVGDVGDRIMTSTDGLTWATTSAAGNNDGWNAVTFGGGMFVAVGDSGDRVMTSTDGLTWATTSAAGNNDNWWSVIYGGGKFVAIGTGPDRAMYSLDGLTWATTSLAGNDDGWTDVNYGNGRFVVVGNSAVDNVAMSLDGINWATTSAAGNDDAWRDVTFGNGQFVAVGSGPDYVMTSTDGLIWTAQSAVAAFWREVSYGNGVYLAVGSTTVSTAMVSPNGQTWTAVSALGNNDSWRGLTYGNGRFVAVGDVGDRIMTSADLNTTFASSASTTNLTITASSTLNAPTSALSIARNFVNNGIFDPRGGTTTLLGTSSTVTGDLTSLDDINTYRSGTLEVVGVYTYTSASAAVPTLRVNSGATFTGPSSGLTIHGHYQNSGTSSLSGTTTFSGPDPLLSGTLTATSSLRNVSIEPISSGQNWTAIATSSAVGNDDTWRGVTYGNGRFVAVSWSVDRIITSTDGLSWTAVATSSAAGNNDTWNSVTYGNGRFVAVGINNDRIITSTDGLSWTAVATSSAAGNNDNWFGVTYGNGRFVAVSQFGDRVMTSTDGLTWATTSAAGDNDSWSSITFGNGRFVAVGITGDRVMTSTDGLTWATTTAAGNNDSWLSVTYGNGRFVAVGNSAVDSVMTSTDGLTWATTSAAGNNDTWNSVTFGNGRFVVVGNSAVDNVAISTDGINWATSSAAGNNDGWQSVTYGDGRFVAVGNSGDRIMTSLGTLTLGTNASTSNLTIATTSSTLNASNSVVSVTGNYTNNGVLTAASSTFILSGTSTQSATGTMSATSSFNNLILSNTSGNGTTSRSITFGAPLSVTGTSTITASTSVAFAAGATTSIATAVWQGSAGSPVYLRSSATGTEWYLDIDGSQLVDYVDVRDSDASAIPGGVINTNTVDAGNNTNWNFAGGGAVAQVWNATDWTLFDTITIQQENIDDDLANFPVYVNLDDLSSQFWATTPTGSTTVGTDIRITNASNVELPRELVSASSTLQTGELHFKADSISSTTDTVFKVWYNGTTTGDYARTDTYGSENVWSNGFVGVWHISEEPNNVAGGYRDSTQYQNHGTGTSMTTAVSGRVGKGQDFDGAANRITVPRDAVLEPTAAITYSAWLRPDGAQVSFAKPFYYGDDMAPGYGPYGFEASGASDVNYLMTLSSASTNITNSVNALSSSTWYQVQGTYNGSVFRSYSNAVEVASTTSSYAIGAYGTLGLGIGDFGDSTGSSAPFNGAVDEIRIASTTRAAAWVKAEYYNQSTSTDFYTVAAAAPTVSVWNATDWTLFDTITIQQENIDDDLTDFPVYVNLSDLSSEFWSTTPTGSTTVGTDIRITNASNVELSRELVSASSTLQTGELHFKADSISSTTDTVFKVWYNGTTAGDYTASSTYGSQNVWSNNYVAVLHAGNGLDSSSNNYHFSANGDATTTSNGKLSSSFSLDGTGDYYDIASLPRFASRTAYTISVWSNLDTIGVNNNIDDGSLFTYGQLAALTDLLFYNVNTSASNGAKKYTFNAGATASLSNRVDGATTPVASQWNYIVGSRNGTNRTLYFDGVSNGSNTGDATANDSSSQARIGSWGQSTDQDFDGRLDEVRIASTTRTAAWILAEYTNQSTSTDFYTVSLATVVGSSTIANHTAGQVSNAFNSQVKTNESLFAFRLTPNSGTATVTDAVISISGVQGFNPFTSITNLRLYRDLDNDALYDVADTQVGGTGVITGADQNGTITFATDFLSTTSENYLVVGDWSAPNNGTFMTLNLYPSGLTIIDATSSQNVFGSVSAIQHGRNNRGGGGGSSAAGGAAPAGDGDTTGGGTEGGELIGDDPDFYWPSANSGSWNNGANAYDRTDGTYATTSAAVTHSYSNAGFVIPTNNTISGVEVKLELAGSTGAGTVDVQLSWNGGANWTTAKTTPPVTTADAVYVTGSASDLWGRTWTAAELSNANFAVRLTGAPNSNTIRVDALQIKVYHQAGGGSQGGGGGGGGI